MLETLLSSGWQQIPPQRKGVGRSFLFEQRGDEGLILEERGDQLWLWIEGNGDRRVLGLTPGAKLAAVLQKIIEMQSTLTVATYLTEYFALQQVCEVSMIMWEQFDNSPPDNAPPPFDVEKAKATAAAAAAQLQQSGGGNDDPVVFPGTAVAKLSDYVALMRLMQTGDMNGAMKKFGLDMNGYMAVMTQWGQKLATDANLTALFGKKMVG